MRHDYVSNAAGWAIVAYITIILIAAYGYIANIVKIIGMLNDPISGMLIARCIGAFAAPLGVILGYF